MPDIDKKAAITNLLTDYADPTMRSPEKAYPNGRVQPAHVNVWNGWPTGLPYIGHEQVTDPHHLFYFGCRFADGVGAQCYARLMPPEVLDALNMRPPSGGVTDHRLVSLRWTLQPTPGQTLLAAPRQLHAIIPPAWGGQHATVVRVGCDHPRKTGTTIGRCYYEANCPDCGWKWRVDSGD